jgi:hypothetical protein
VICACLWQTKDSLSARRWPTVDTAAATSANGGRRRLFVTFVHPDVDVVLVSTQSSCDDDWRPTDGQWTFGEIMLFVAWNRCKITLNFNDITFTLTAAITIQSYYTRTGQNGVTCHDIGNLTSWMNKRSDWDACSSRMHTNLAYHQESCSLQDCVLSHHTWFMTLQGRISMRLKLC